MRRLFLAFALSVGTAPALACGPAENIHAVMEDGQGSDSIVASIGEVRLSEPFNIDFYDCTGILPEGADLRIDAVMPAHQHGMNYAPRVSRPEANKVSVSGMVFHMPGHWVIELAVFDGDVTRYTLEYHLK